MFIDEMTRHGERVERSRWKFRGNHIGHELITLSEW